MWLSCLQHGESSAEHDHVRLISRDMPITGLTILAKVNHVIERDSVGSHEESSWPLLFIYTASLGSSFTGQITGYVRGTPGALGVYSVHWLPPTTVMSPLLKNPPMHPLVPQSSIKCFRQFRMAVPQLVMLGNGTIDSRENLRCPTPGSPQYSSRQ